MGRSIFDISAAPLGWFDPNADPKGWFDPDLLAPGGAPPADLIIRLLSGREVAGGASGFEVTSKANGRLGFVLSGSDPTLKLEAGRRRFARARVASTPIDWGDTGSGGGGNWPTTGDRALMRFIAAANTLTLTQFNMRMKNTSTGVGDRFRGLVYMADAAGGYPGTLVGYSDPTNATTGGTQLLTATCSISVPVGDYWIGYVCDGGSGSGSETDSGGTATDVAIMLNGGEVDYASPPSLAGLWPGSPGPYSNIPALWFDGTF